MSGKSITDLTIASLLEKRVVMEYDANRNPIYIGQAEPGTAKDKIGWRIKKLIWDGENLTDILWAKGSQKFEFIWDERTNYSYS